MKVPRIPTVLSFFTQLGIALSCICIAQSPSKPSANATADVEGVVAMKGLPDVTVRLERIPTDPLSYSDGYLATVEPDGRFHFEDVAPGDYRLTASSSSEMHREFGSPALGSPGTTIELKAGETRKDLALDLFPDPVGVCGRVLDADGKPMRTDVEIYKPEFTGDGAKLRPVSEQPVVLTDPNGYFLLSSWLIPNSNQRPSRLFLRANGVWYPSTENFADAVAVPADAISQSGCKTIIQMPRARCEGHRVIGKVQDMPAGAQSGYEISLYEVNPANVLFQKDTQPSIYNTDHVEFDNVCDGSYAIFTWPDKPRSPSIHDVPGYFASRLFHVDGKDTDVTIAGMDQREVWKLTNQQDIWTQSTPNLPPPAPASIQGLLELMDGLTWKQACPSGVSQQLRLEHGATYEEAVRRDGGDQPKYAVLDKGGHFSFDNLEPGAYTLQPGTFAHGAAYVKNLSVNGRALASTHFTLAAGETAKVHIELSNNAAEAAGKPRAGNSEPHYLSPGTHPATSLQGKVTGLDAAGAEVKLTAIRPSSARSSRLQTTAASDGTFQFEGVDPGIYKLSSDGDHHQYSEYGAKEPGLEGLPILVSAGQNQRGLDLKAFAKTTLCGRVIDPAGHPRAGIEVWIRGYTNVPNANGSPGDWTKQAVTDADGRYTIPEVGPGYRELWAKDGDTLTYFPSGVDANKPHDMADLKPEQQGCVFNIYLRGADGGSAVAHAVSGTVEGKFDTSLGDRFYVELEPADREFTPSVERVQMKEPGNFTLKNVWPGKYMLTLYGEYGSGNLPCGVPSSICFGYYHHPLASQQITATNRNVEGLRLSIGALPTLDGEFVVDDKLPQGSTTLNLTLFWGNESKTITADASGHFSFPPLDAFRYGFSLTEYAPENAYQWVNYGPVYIASATLDGKLVNGRHFELLLGQKAHLVIHVKVGATRGKLTVAAGGPPVDSYKDPCVTSFGGGWTAELMIPDPLPDDNSGIIGIAAQPENNGEGYVQSARPGHYRVVAVDNVGIPTQHVWGQTPAATSHDFLVRLAALGNTVDVVAGKEFEFTAPLLTEQAQQLMVEIGMPATH